MQTVQPSRDPHDIDTSPMSTANSMMERRYIHVLQPLLLALLVGLPVLLGMSFLQHDPRSQWVALASLIAVVAFMYVQLLRGRGLLVSHALVFSLIIYTSIGLLTYGSVRSAVAVGYAAAIVAAGMMLSRRALVVATALSIGALSALVWAESTGLLVRSDFSVGAKFWGAHVLILVCVAIAVGRARQMVRHALLDQRAEISLRERIEHELRLSEDRFSRIFRTSPVAIVVQSAEDRIVLDINPAFERLYGYSRADIVGSAKDIALWENIADRAVLAERLATQGIVSNFPTRGRRKDGSTFDALISTSIEGVGPGLIIVSNITDVSAETLARESARQSQELFAKAFDFSPMNLAITRVADGIYLAVNSSDPVLGYASSELVGQSSLDVGSWLNPADRQDFVDELSRTGQVLRYETQMRHKDGHLIDCMMWAVKVDIAGESCVLSSTLNVSEEKRREDQLLELARGVAGETGERFFHVLVEQLAKALDADMVMAGEVDDAGQVQSLGLINDGALMPPFSCAVAGTPIAHAMEQSGVYSVAEGVSGLFPDDALLAGDLHSYSGIALRDADGTPIGILQAAWRSAQPDSNDRHALFSIFASRCNAELLRLRRDREIQGLNETLELRVKARTAQLQASNAELESFSYSVSHDLKAPLSSIDGFTALLVRRMGDRLDPEEQRMFERIRTNVARMHELITALLSLAQISRYKVEPQDVDLSAMAHEWFEAAQARDPQRVVQTFIQPGLVAHSDRRMARIVLDNLLGNAWKYSRNNPQAHIEFGEQRHGNETELYVRDNGVGFDMDHASQLFKPFHRLHNVTDYDGNGIGLATVHRILERHGGHIRAESAVNAGTTFLFSFDSAASPAPDLVAPPA